MLAPKPILYIDDPLDELVDAAEKHIAHDPSIFQRSGEVVYVVHGKDGYSLKPLRTSVLRYMMSKTCMWVKENKSIHPPTSIARCILDKPGWDNIKPIRAITSFPPISTTGNLITSKGYHADTSIFFTGEVNCNIPDRPTLHDAKRAIEIIYDIVSGFPFANEAHRSAWLAALLSPLSRFLHDGNIPIVLVQANAPRVGKTRLIKLISYIVNGVDCPVITHTKNEDEERKRIITCLRAGKSMVLVDNIVGQYGGAVINALATSRFIEDRVLGHSRLLQLVNDTTWCITGNNITLAPDTAERCLHIRLICSDEKPHLRSGFKYPNLFEAVTKNRTLLLGSALTILKAYLIAGLPHQEMEMWGSFEEWSRIVRGTLLWCNQPDPAITRSELESEADVSKDVFSSFIYNWFELQKDLNSPNGLTAKEVLDYVHRRPRSLLAFAIEELCGSMPNPHTLGRHLREIRDRNYSNKIMKCIPNTSAAHRWLVVEA